MMPRVWISACLLLVPARSFAQDADSIVGQWYTEEGRSIVEIYKCDTYYCGKILWLKYPEDEEGREKVDKENPDETKRTRKLIGLNILWGFSYEGEDGWEDGKIYDPKNGKTYSCRITLDGDNLKVRGYIGFSLLGRTTVWTRKA
jgi:uncharacterized protein (DUF2147 family)